MTDDGRQFHVELAAAQAAVVEHRRLDERLGVVGSVAAAARAELARATESLADQNVEVQNLVRPGPALAVAILKGERAERLAAGRAAQRAAGDRVTAAHAAVDSAERELAAVQASLDGLGDVDAWYAAALAAKETWLIQVGAVVAGDLRGLSKQSEVLRRELAGLREPADAAHHARAALSAALRHLDEARELALDERRARSWPTRRPLILSEGPKADLLAQAVGLMRRAAAALRVLTRVVDDRGLDADGLLAEELVGTFDFLFDTNHSSAVFMDRIDGATERVHQALDAVERADLSIGRQTAGLRARLAELGRRREEMLTNS